MADVGGKVILRDFDVFQVILDQVTDLFSNEVQNIPSIDDETKKRSCQQFKEVFCRTVNNNVETIGRQLVANDACKVQETKKTEKEKLDILNAVLYPQMTSVIEEVAKKRKMYPPLCCQPITEQLDKNLEYVKRNVSEAKLANPTTSSKSSHSSLLKNKDEFLKLARESSSNLVKFKKDAEPITKRAGRLKLAQRQWMDNRNPKIVEEG